MLAPCDEGHILARLRQPAAEVSAHGSRPEHRYTHGLISYASGFAVVVPHHQNQNELQATPSSNPPMTSLG